jgi:hypothetical protein
MYAPVHACVLRCPCVCASLGAGGVSDEWVTLRPMHVEAELDHILGQVRIPSSY